MNLALPDGVDAAAHRQILDMKYIYLKVRELKVFDAAILSKIINRGFSLTVQLPLPDVKNREVAMQTVAMRNYDVVTNDEFLFNSTSSYQFKISEPTLAQFSESYLGIDVQLPPGEPDRHGVAEEPPVIRTEMQMNKLLLANNF